MQVKTDVRHHLGIVVSQASDLVKALRELPEREDEMIAALQALSGEERAQAVASLARLSQAFGEIRQRTQWLRQRMQAHVEGGLGGRADEE